MTEALLSALRAKANARGLVVVRDLPLLGSLRMSTVELDRALSALTERHEIEVLSPRPYLVLRLCSWRGVQHALDAKPAQSGLSSEEAIRARGYSHSYSYSQSREVGGVGEGEADRDTLLQEILEVLGESDPRAFAKVLDHYSPEHVRRVLRRVASKPAQEIHTSRTALFRYLIRHLND